MKTGGLLSIQKKKLSAGSFKLICSHSCNLFKKASREKVKTVAAGLRAMKLKVETALIGEMIHE